MKVVTASQMQHIDRTAIEEYGIPSTVLMGFAGKSVSDFIIKKYTPTNRTAIFCGPGNNGGDGLVIAYLLHNAGFPVTVYVCTDPDKYNEVPAIYYSLCQNNNIRIYHQDHLSLEISHFVHFDLVIDALLGTGFKGAARKPLKDVITLINTIKKNRQQCSIISVDIASGLASDGPVDNPDIVTPDETISIGLPKINQVTYPGKNFTGNLTVVDISFPKELTESPLLTTILVDHEYCSDKKIFTHDPDTHKGREGHILAVGGFPGMEGAIILSCKAALETGCGLISLVTHPDSRKQIAGLVPELMTHPVSLDPPGMEHEINSIFQSRRIDTIVIGPGMGRSAQALQLFQQIITISEQYSIKRTVIDGDGLYHLATFLQKNKLSDKTEYIITPHFKEAQRLLKTDIEQIKQDRPASAAQLSVNTNAICVLKGPNTIIADRDNLYINTSGNSLLATGGSGDVLSGIIAALSLKKISAAECAATGVFIHGQCADIIQQDFKKHALKSGDLINYISRAISTLQ